MLVLSPEERIEVSDSIVMQALPAFGQFYAFDVTQGDHYRLNETAHWILTVIGEGITYNELKIKFAERFAVTNDVAHEDVTEFLAFAFENQLISKG